MYRFVRAGIRAAISAMRAVNWAAAFSQSSRVPGSMLWASPLVSRHPACVFRKKIIEVVSPERAFWIRPWAMAPIARALPLL